MPPVVLLWLLLAPLLTPVWGAQSLHSRSAENTRVAAHTREGDGLVARDELTGEQGWKRVTRLWRGETERVCYLTVIPQRRGRGERRRQGTKRGQEGGEEGSEPAIGPLRVEDAQQTIRCTPGHGFFEARRGAWIPAGGLRPGDNLLTPDGGTLKVLRVETRSESSRTFNLTVQDWHTYFVGSCEVGPAALAHNNNGGCGEEFAEGFQAIDPRNASIRGAHDVGVSAGREAAERLGLRETNWINPFENQGAYGQGFDEILEDANGALWIAEYKGGQAALSSGQMGPAWVDRNIQRLANEGGWIGNHWANRLRAAQASGQLRGIAFSTGLDRASPQPTQVIGIWNY